MEQRDRPDGAEALARALQGNHMLLTLEMRGNRAGDEGAAAFAAMMPNSQALSTLDLMDNGMTKAGTQALLDGLKVSRANPYLLLYASGLPHEQWTSWQAKGKADAP